MKQTAMLLLALAIVACADVSKETFTSVKTMSGMVTSEITAQTELRDTMQAENQAVQTKAIVGGSTTHIASITRLDKGLLWSINNDNKTYTESPLKPPESTAAKPQAGTAQKPDTSQWKIVKSDFSVKKLDSTKTINGFPCAEYVATWTNVVADLKTGDTSTSVMTLNEWTTPETDVLKQAEAEEAAYGKAYAAKLGLTMDARQSATMGMAYMGSMGMDPKQLGDKLSGFGSEMAKIQGYAIVTETQWETESKAAPASQNTGSQAEPGGSNSLSQALNNALAQRLNPNSNQPGKNIMFSSYTEVKSIKVGATPDKDYVVPDGYKLK